MRGSARVARSIAIAVIVLLSPLGANADEMRLDHRGALGLELLPGVEHASLVVNTNLPPPNFDATRFVLGLEPTIAIGREGNEIVGTLRLLRGPDWGAAFGARFRKYFGRDEWKTFADFGIKVDSTPRWAAGPHVGLGVMYEFSPLVGVFANLGGSIEFGNGIRAAAEGFLGLQARSYLIE